MKILGILDMVFIHRECNPTWYMANIGDKVVPVVRSASRHISFMNKSDLFAATLMFS